MKDFPILTTEHLLLDAYRDSDEDRVAAILHQADVFKNVFGENEHALNRFLSDLKQQAKCDAPDMIHWMARLRKGDPVIGCVKARAYQSQSVELVFFLDEDERRNKYGFEMVSEVVSHLVSLNGVEKLWASVRSAATAHILVKKLGFEHLLPTSRCYLMLGRHHG